MSQQPDEVLKVVRDKHKHIVPGGKGYRFKVGTYMDENGQVKDLSKWIFDHSKGHEFPDGDSMGPHFNVQVDERVGDDVVRVWGKEHYWYG